MLDFIVKMKIVIAFFMFFLLGCSATQPKKDAPAPEGAQQAVARPQKPVVQSKPAAQPVRAQAQPAKAQMQSAGAQMQPVKKSRKWLEFLLLNQLWEMQVLSAGKNCL